MNGNSGDLSKSKQPSTDLPSAAVAGLAYLLILLCIWGPFVQTSGMGWETYYTIVSETARSWRNFLYTPDPMRIHAANFYELAYVLGDWAGVRGSFVPYQIAYGVLWWFRSFLGFLLIRKLIPKPAILSFGVGAIMLIHAPDVLIGWLGQLHQFGVFVWLLISLYLLVKALETVERRAAYYIVASWLFQYLCLWTYEAPLFIILAAPLAFAFLMKRKLDRRSIVVISSWYLPSVIYAGITYVRYLRMGGNGYQMSLLRKSFALKDILSDWFFNVGYSLSFPSWQKIQGDMEPAAVTTLALGVVLVFLVGAIVLCRQQRYFWEGVQASTLVRLLAVGIVFLFLSFPAHLLLEGARSLRRTQLLSAIAASIVLAVLATLLANWLPGKGLRSVAAIVLMVPIVWIGACRVVERQSNHRAEWNTNLVAMRDLIRGVPRVQEGTIVVMTNVPRDRDPFSAFSFWFNNALRLAYPRTQVAGVYYYDDGRPEPSDNLTLSDNQWKFTGEGISPLIQSADINQTLVLEFQRNGPPKVLSQIPAFLCKQGCGADRYQPQTRILPGPPAPEPTRRYGPF